MSYKSGFFNAVKDGDTYDRVYNAEDMSNYFEGLVTDGVYANVGGSLAVTANGMGVNIATGRAILDCHWIKNSSVTSLAIDSSSSASDRKDLIVIKLDKSVEVRSMEFQVLKSTSSLPKATDDVKYLALARVTVKAGATSIGQSNIEDLRGTSSCLYVTGLIEQIDTSTLFTQFKAAFEDFFSTLQSELKVDTYIAKYESIGYLSGANGTASNGSASDYVTFEISDYDPKIDVLLIFENGLHCIEDTDYTIVSTHSGLIVDTHITIKSPYSLGYTENDEFQAIMLKSRIGSSTEGIDVDA
jgi:hypothetical protein